MDYYLKRRPRRTRQNEAIRSLVRENHLSIDDLILPVFVQEEKTRPISSMPNIFCYSVEDVLRFCEQVVESGILAIALFPAIKPENKDKKATYALDENNFYLKTITNIKKNYPHLLLITDIALDPYNSDGHDGLVVSDGSILNDETLEVLAQMALLQASAGADILGPSDMMDGRIAFLRKKLDAHGYENILLLSYTAKYASHFYNPFRTALDSDPKKGDKKTYQMDFANSKEALLEAKLDFEQGADMLMVKPALAYLDIIQRFSQSFELPIVAYNVSGEYAMVQAAVRSGFLEYEKTMSEILIAFKRAGSDMILTYHALDMAKLLDEKI